MYCDYCDHPIYYHDNNSCSMPVIVGTFIPKGAFDRETQQCPCPGKLHTYTITEEPS